MCRTAGGQSKARSRRSSSARYEALAYRNRVGALEYLGLRSVGGIFSTTTMFLSVVTAFRSAVTCALCVHDSRRKARSTKARLTSACRTFCTTGRVNLERNESVGQKSC